jgi:hypothetical protein
MKPADYAEGAMVRGEVNSTFDYLGDDYLQIGPEDVGAIARCRDCSSST